MSEHVKQSPPIARRVSARVAAAERDKCGRQIKASKTPFKGRESFYILLGIYTHSSTELRQIQGASAIFPRPLAPPQKPKPLVLPVDRRHACLAGPPANTCFRNRHQNKTQSPIVIPESPPQGGLAFPSESRPAIPRIADDALKTAEFACFFSPVNSRFVALCI